MKKQAVTLESLQTNMESMQKNMEKGFDIITKTLVGMQSNEKHVNLKLDKLESMQSDIKRINSRLENVDSKLENIEKNLSDTQENVRYLVADALMRDELQPILDHVITQSESRMISHMEGFMRRHITMEEEVLIHGAKIRVIEQVLGLPNAV